MPQKNRAKAEGASSVKVEGDIRKVNCKQEVLTFQDVCRNNIREGSFSPLDLQQAIRIGRYPPGCRVNYLHRQETYQTNLAFNATVLDVGINVYSKERETIYKVRFDVYDNFGWITDPVIVLLREDNLVYAPFTPVWVYKGEDRPKEGLITSASMDSSDRPLYTVQTFEQEEAHFQQATSAQVGIRLVGSAPPPPREWAGNEAAAVSVQEGMKQEEPVAMEAQNTLQEQEEEEEEQGRARKRRPIPRDAEVICIDIDEDDEQGADQEKVDEGEEQGADEEKEEGEIDSDSDSHNEAANKRKRPPTTTESNMVESPQVKHPRLTRRVSIAESVDSSGGDHTIYRKFLLPEKLGVEFVRRTICGDQGATLKQLSSRFDVKLALRGSAIAGSGIAPSSPEDEPLFLDIHAKEEGNIVGCCEYVEMLLYQRCHPQLQTFVMYKLTSLNRPESELKKGSGIWEHKGTTTFMTMVRLGSATHVKQKQISIEYAREFSIAWEGSCNCEILPRSCEKHPQVKPHILVSGDTLESVSDFCKGLFASATAKH